MDFSLEMTRSRLSLGAILIFSVLQVITGQSTMTSVTSSEPISELHTPQNICSQEPPSCPNPNNLNPDHGSFKLKFSFNCEPYLELTCDPGYTRTVDIVYCVNNNWEPSITEDATLCAANCAAPPNIAFAEVFLLPENSDTIDAVDDSTTAEYVHEAEIIYQCLYYNTFSSVSSLQRSRCTDGNWEPSPTLECTANKNKCQGEITGLVVLGVFFGVETILLIGMLTFCCMRRCHSNNDDPSMAVPNKKHSGNTYSGQHKPTPKTSMEDTPVYPPPRPPARTDTAVISEDDGSYYTYADVPVENGNDRNTENINGDDTLGPGVKRNKSIPQYLEIIS